MDKALRDAVGALQISRPHLGIFTAEKGDITFQDPSCYISKAAQGSSGTSIGESMLEDDHMVSTEVGEQAKVVLVVEKDTVFQHLLHSGLLATLPLILVTGRGYPDVLTRRFLQKLQRIRPELPQLYLGDFDPDGAWDISKVMGVAIYLLYLSSCPHLKWLGLHSGDVRRLPRAAALPLSRRDRSLQASLLRREEVQRNPAMVAELEAMDSKFELEALHAGDDLSGRSHMAHQFIPQKIQSSSWI
eukprot:Skav203822  [mRNA]  locus=scaffold505:183513:186253:- [translate_table: standard]